MRTFPSERVPDGWFMIGWGTDFTAGETVALSYFDRELVAARGASGELRVFDAYCPHMGAHLGHSGCVDGDSIRCLYHGWLFDADGRNSEIPYSRPDRMNVGLRQYTTREIDGLAFVYHSYEYNEPAHDLPETFMTLPGDTWDICPETTKIWRDVPMIGQFVTENTADVAHFKWVHGAGDVPSVSTFSSEPSVHRSTIDITFGGGMASTWATPNGAVDGQIITESWGLGIGWSRLVGFDDLIFLACFTPITPTRLDFRTTSWVAKTRGDGSIMDERTRNRWVSQQNFQVEADMDIWRTQTYVARAPFTKDEQPCMRSVRQWSKQFYSDLRDPRTPQQPVGASPTKTAS